MKRYIRNIALKAHRLAKRHGAVVIATKLKLPSTDAAVAIANVGLLIEQLEAHRLTANELLVMTTLARMEARRVELGAVAPYIGGLDRTAGKRSGWSGKVIAKRLRQARPADAGVRDIMNRLDFVACPIDAGRIWLTPAGWAFVWATGLILRNWKVPA